LAFLFFLAGFEIDFGRSCGQPLELAAYGWLLSIALSVAVAAALYATDVIVLVRYVAIAMLSVFIFPLLALTLVRPRQILSGVEGASASV
jgi:hypothetical protein